MIIFYYVSLDLFFSIPATTKLWMSNEYQRKKNFQNVTRKRNHQVQKEKSLSTQLLVVVHFYYSKITFSSSWKVTNMKNKKINRKSKKNKTKSHCYTNMYSERIFSFYFLFIHNYQKLPEQKIGYSCPILQGDNDDDVSSFFNNDDESFP